MSPQAGAAPPILSFPSDFPAQGAFFLQDQSARRKLGREEVSGLPLFLLNQVHEAEGAEIDKSSDLESRPRMDFQWTREKNLGLGIFVADCSAIFFCGPSRNKKRESVLVAIHAGWRGTQENILEKAVEVSGLEPKLAEAWISPGISAAVYEVGAEVKEAFPASASAFFRPSEKRGHFYFDLKTLQKSELQRLQLKRVYSHPLCTFSQKDFFSYRRDQSSERHLAYAYLPKN